MSSNNNSSRRRRRLERMRQRQPHLAKSFQKLQQQSESSVNELPPEQDAQPPADASSLYEYDLLAWGKHYLPHYFQQPPSQMHIEVAAILDADSRRCDEERRREEEAKKANATPPPGLSRGSE